ncbi:MAG: hypothetical protein IKF36_04455 [Bacilli bacterium]|nr:hypothetical protein [Bacilli bacterium]
MRIITTDKYETRFPISNEEYYYSLKPEEKNMYLNLVAKYYNLLLNFLIQKGSLKSLDESLKNSKNSFIKVNEDEMDLYQYISSEYLQFLYIRNNVYVERLSREDLNYLNDIDLNSIKDDDFDFVKRTYKSLINENYNEASKTNFGPLNEAFITDSDALIIGLRIDDYRLDDGLDADKIFNIEAELDFAKSYIEAKLENIVSNVKVIRYKSDSIKSLNKR